MNILGFNITREKRGLNNPDAYVTSPYSMGLTFGQLLANQSNMSLSAVYRCVDLISDGVAMLPIRVMSGGGVVDHPLDEILTDRNNLQTKYNFIKLLIQSVLLRGNGYAYIQRNSDGSVKHLQFVESGDVTVNYDKRRQTLTYSIPTITNKRIEPINVVHLKKYTLDGVNGISVISAADKTLKLSKYAEGSAENFYSKGGNLNGIIISKTPMKPNQKTDFLNSWQTTYGDGGRGIAILEGDMSFERVQLSAQDAQLIETRKFNATDIARFFGVAPSLIGINEGSSYGSIEAEQQAFILHTLMPYVAMMEAELTAKLLPSGLRVDLDETYLLKADKTATANYYNSLVSGGIMSINEARQALGFQPVKGGDDLIIPYSDTAQNKVSNNNE